ncbi:MAG: hypothetical protein ABJF23_27545, partial [Bryobacteraceae bacterium]
KLPVGGIGPWIDLDRFGGRIRELLKNLHNAAPHRRQSLYGVAPYTKMSMIHQSGAVSRPTLCKFWVSQIRRAPSRLQFKL